MSTKPTQVKLTAAPSIPLSSQRAVLNFTRHQSASSAAPLLGAEAPDSTTAKIGSHDQNCAHDQKSAPLGHSKRKTLSKTQSVS